MSDLSSAKMTAAEASLFLHCTLQYIHKILKMKNLESKKSQNRVYFGHKTSKVLFDINFKRKVVAFQIVKGGTGKTSIAHSFAIRSNLYGAKVLCIDLDQQGNLTQAFNIDAGNVPVMIDVLKEQMPISSAIINVSEGLDLLPSRIENATLDNFIMLNKKPLDKVYKNLFSEVIGEYDLVVIDCPPALGQSVAAATLASDIVIAPLTPEQFSLSGLNVTFEEISKLAKDFDKKIDIKIVLNKFDSRTALSTEVLTTILNDHLFKSRFCKTFIRSCQDFPNAIYSGSNIYASLRTTMAKEDIDLFTREILELDEIKENAIAV